MKKNIPTSIVDTNHPDYALLHDLQQDIYMRVGGEKAFNHQFPSLLRESIDDVIQTARTGRRTIHELEKTEKTYIGTRVEIFFRDLIKAPKGKLDLSLLQQDVDVKFTRQNNWMIPTEAIGHPCVLIAADEDRSLCYVGIAVAKLEYLGGGQNKDGKKTITAENFKHIYWLLNSHPYPTNFWNSIKPEISEAIYIANAGNDRIYTLFKHVQGRPINRNTIEAVARQKDFMRRLRGDSSRKDGGTRGRLLNEGIELLSGAYDQKKINEYGLGEVARDEFISHTKI